MKKNIFLITVFASLLVGASPALAVNKELIAALESTYETNPSIKAQREALKALDERMSQAISGFRPTVNIDYQKGRRRSDTNSTTGWDYQDTKSRQLTVSQPIFNGGSTWAEVKAAQNAIKAGRAELNSTTQQTLLNTIIAYVDIFQNESVLDLSKKNVEVLERQLKASQDRFNVGEVTRTDVAQSEARLSRAKAELSDAQGNLDASKATFERLTGIKPTNIILTNEFPTIPPTLEAAKRIALDANPTLISGRFNEKSQNYVVNGNIGRLLPQVSLDGTMSREDGASIFQREFDNDTLLLNVRIPVYQAGSEYSRIREAKRNYQRLKFDTLDLSNQTNEQTTRTWERLKAVRESIKSNEDAIKAAEIALDGVKQEQQFGARTTLDVLDAEQELFAARVNLVRSQRDEVVAVYNLLAVLGQLTPTNLGMKVDEYNPRDNYNTVKWIPLGF